VGPQAAQALPAEQGTRAKGNSLDHEALVWVLSALSQYFRIPFDEKLVTSQLSPPYDFDTVARAAGSLGLRAGWKALPAARLKKLTAPFVVLLSPVISEPPESDLGFDGKRKALLDPEAPVRRLAFVLHIEEDRVAFFEQGAWLLGVLNVLGTVFLCLVAGGLGLWVGRAVVST